MRNAAVKAMMEFQYRWHKVDDIDVEFLYARATEVSDMFNTTIPATEHVFKVTIYFSNDDIIEKIVSIASSEDINS